MEKSGKQYDMNLPIWFDGKSINEALFCDDFLGRHKIIFANGAFFTPEGRVTDNLPLRGEIFEELRCCAVNNIPRKINNILEVMKLDAHCNTVTNAAGRRVWGFRGIEAVARPDMNGFISVSPCTYVPEEWRD